MNEKVMSLVPNKPDAEVAQEYKQRAMELYKPMLELLNEAHKNGFVINIQAGVTPMGIQITNLQVLKSF